MIFSLWAACWESEALLFWNNNESENQFYQEHEMMSFWNNNKSESWRTQKTDFNQSWYLVKNFKNKIKVL